MMVGAVLLMLMILPSLLRVMAGQSSTAFGLLAASAMIFPLLLGRVGRVRFSARAFLVLCVYLALMVLPLGKDGASLFKTSGSFLMACFYALFVVLLSRAVVDSSYQSLAKGFRITAAVLFVIGWVAILFGFAIQGFGYETAHRAVFPFSEPSHYVMVAGPVTMVLLVVMPKRWQKYLLLNTVLQALLFPSLAMLIYLVLMLAVWLPFRWMVVTAAIGAVGAIAAYEAQSEQVQYFAQRLMVSSQSNNLTTLAFVQGWYDARLALSSTHGLGLGFQMLGTQPPSEISERINELLGVYINREDGGAGLAAKAIAEFGYAGIAVSLAALLAIIRSFRVVHRAFHRNRQSTEGAIDPRELVLHMGVWSFLVELLLRNLGYFSPTFILFGVALLSLRQMRRASRYDGNRTVATLPSPGFAQ